MSKRVIGAVAFLVAVAGLAAPAGAQIRVHPTGVNVNAQGATTVFLTFGGLNGQLAAESEWCGRLVPATPAIGFRCDPTTVYGRLPARFVQTRPTAATGLTDIMSIPPSVARRAYQAAEAGETAGFFYVRRFAGTGGQPDEFVAVTCRLAGGGARTPLSLVDVSLGFAIETPVLFVQTGEAPAAVTADITYTGTGRLQGRWEVVLPGEDLPAPEDLLTEATLPVELRGTQRRYTQLERFNVFLPPTGRIQLPGPDPRVLPTAADGTYLLLLRIETSPDKEADSNLASAGAGAGVVRAGAVAGFPMPTLRYVVGRSTSEGAAVRTATEFALLAPAPDALADGLVVFSWTPANEAALYRLEVENEGGQVVHAAFVARNVTSYRAPSWLAERSGGIALRWRVVALSTSGRVMQRSEWRSLSLAASGGGTPRGFEGGNQDDD